MSSRSPSIILFVATNSFDASVTRTNFMCDIHDTHVIFIASIGVPEVSKCIYGVNKLVNSIVIS